MCVHPPPDLTLTYHLLADSIGCHNVTDQFQMKLVGLINNEVN